ncbi:MAG: hypothetical protein ACK5OB_21235 [Pirellula sp.]
MLKTSRGYLTEAQLQSQRVGLVLTRRVHRIASKLDKVGTGS